jgi:hypothetical protein
VGNTPLNETNQLQGREFSKGQRLCFPRQLFYVSNAKKSMTSVFTIGLESKELTETTSLGV